MYETAVCIGVQSRDVILRGTYVPLRILRGTYVPLRILGSVEGESPYKGIQKVYTGKTKGIHGPTNYNLPVYAVSCEKHKLKCVL